MAKIHVKTVSRYSGWIKVAGVRFDYETSATSDKEAMNNGIAQYSRKINMSIGVLRRYLKEHGATMEAVEMVDRRNDKR